MLPRARTEGIVSEGSASRQHLSEPSTGRTWELSALVHAVWVHADGRSSVADIASAVSAEQDVEVSEQQVWAALDLLADEGLTDRIAPPASSSAQVARRSFVLRTATAAVAVLGAAAVVGQPVLAAASTGGKSGHSKGIPGAIATLQSDVQALQATTEAQSAKITQLQGQATEQGTKIQALQAQAAEEASKLSADATTIAQDGKQITQLQSATAEETSKLSADATQDAAAEQAAKQQQEQAAKQQAEQAAKQQQEQAAKQQQEQATKQQQEQATKQQQAEQAAKQQQAEQNTKRQQVEQTEKQNAKQQQAEQHAKVQAELNTKEQATKTPSAPS